jgi:serine/threonine protein kinase
MIAFILLCHPFIGRSIQYLAPTYLALDMEALTRHFTTIRVLGEGGFGIVKLVKSRKDGQVCILR